MHSWGKRDGGKEEVNRAGPWWGTGQRRRLGRMQIARRRAVFSLRYRGLRKLRRYRSSKKKPERKAGHGLIKAKDRREELRSSAKGTQGDLRRRKERPASGGVPPGEALSVRRKETMGSPDPNVPLQKSCNGEGSPKNFSGGGPENRGRCTAGGGPLRLKRKALSSS